jgi:hypothetical protein
VSAGQSPYPHASLIVDNYPPLSFYAVAGLGRVTGDFVSAGRLASLASFVAVVLCVFLAARRLGAGRPGAALGASVYLASMFLYTHYVGIDDPQISATRSRAPGSWCFSIRARATSGRAESPAHSSSPHRCS